MFCHVEEQPIEFTIITLALHCEVGLSIHSLPDVIDYSDFHDWIGDVAVSDCDPPLFGRTFALDLPYPWEY